MKSIIYTVFAAAVVAAPVVSFAQSDEPVTRAQVRTELEQLERAGYNPTANDDSTYPADIQAAEARIGAQKAQASGLGGAVSGSSATGAPIPVRPASPE